MKKLKIGLLCCIIVMNTSCATIIRGSGTQCQKTPSPDREIRVGMVILDLIWMFPFNAIFLITDAKTGALYKPCTTIPKN